MTTNKYFNPHSYAREQDLIEDLIIESIKIHGFEMKYLPRTAVRNDHLFGEDPSQRFEFAIPIEMYIKNVDGFGGEGDVLSKFGVDLRDQITFTVARKRWNQIRTEKLTTETGYIYQLESANTGAPSNTISILMEDNNGNNYNISSTRPLEGDIIYFALSNDMFEIKFVEHEAIFYQTGSLQTYDLICEKWAYSHERIDTGDAAVDIFETNYSQDLLAFEVLMETGDQLLAEDGQSYKLERRVEAADAQANNELFAIQSKAIFDFSDKNPFSDSVVF